MISNLRGTVIHREGRLVVMEVGGVGYEVWCTTGAAAELSIGVTAAIVVHTAVREDEIRLFGFRDRLEQQVFRLLLGVSGVGAKTASELVSGVGARELLRAIPMKDLATLTGVKGIGRKTAEKILVDLHDRLGALSNREDSSQPSDATFGVRGDSPHQLALQALEALGFSRREVEPVLKAIMAEGGNLETGDIVRQALGKL